MPIILAQPLRHAVPTARVQAMRLAAPPAACVPPLYCACSQPWAERSFWNWPAPNVSWRAKRAITVQTTVHVAFLPGENQQIVDLPIPIPVGKRLFLQDIHLLPDLPEGQHASLSIGYKLHVDGNGYAPVGLYADPGMKIKAQVERDLTKSAGQVTLIAEGYYYDIPSR